MGGSLESTYLLGHLHDIQYMEALDSLAFFPIFMHNNNIWQDLNWHKYVSVKGALRFIWLLVDSHYYKLFDTQSTKQLNIVAISVQATLKTLH